MEPKTQAEVQLGHMCNNRCVFCVSGQQTEKKRALPMHAPTILPAIEQAAARGHKKVTLLGGEPTLQPGFFQTVERCVELGFEEIVIFTNGVKTSRARFVDQVIATGGHFVWRLSIQGGDKQAHEQTTRRPQSFDRIVATLENLRRRGQRITVNMCVVGSNFESLPKLANLIAPYGVEQVHLDMVRPLDAGERTELEFSEMLPRYSALAAPMTQLVESLPAGFDINIGNLPFCIAPHLSHHIHHDGEQTETVAVDGENQLSEPWDKYAVKRRDKGKPNSCSRCLFDAECNGIFDKYRTLYGIDEFLPVTAENLIERDPERRWSGAQLRLTEQRLRRWTPSGTLARLHVERRGELRLRLTLGCTSEPGGGGDPSSFPNAPAGSGSLADWTVELDFAVRSGVEPRWEGRRSDLPAAAFSGVVVFVLRWPDRRDDVGQALSELSSLLGTICGRVLHPLGHDAVPGLVCAPVLRRVLRLRAAAPFGVARWTSLEVADSGNAVCLGFASPTGTLRINLSRQGSGARLSYELPPGPGPHTEAIEALREILLALTPKERRTEQVGGLCQAQ